MRLDTLSVAVAIFIVGLVLSSLSLSDVFRGLLAERFVAPHQQGFVIEAQN